MKDLCADTVDVIKKLKEGNLRYLSAARCDGDMSESVRKSTAQNGQHPYAVIIACADSRVISEGIFMAGIGELFVIRVAGNVVGEIELGSIQYAIEHLGVKDVVVLGHTHCGAVHAAICGGADGYTAAITDKIKQAIGDEKDECHASALNVKSVVFDILSALKYDDVSVHGAIYDIESGKVDFEI